MTAFTTLPFCTCPSGAASFTLAVITSPKPARNPVAPPSGRIICSLRAPELSATSSMVLIITAMANLLFLSPVTVLPLRCAPAPAQYVVLLLSAASVSAWIADESLQDGPHLRCERRFFRRGHKISCPWKRLAHRRRATSFAPPRRRLSFSCGWKPLHQPLLYAGQM